MAEWLREWDNFDFMMLDGSAISDQYPWARMSKFDRSYDRYDLVIYVQMAKFITPIDDYGIENQNNYATILKNKYILVHIKST